LEDARALAFLYSEELDLVVSELMTAAKLKGAGIRVEKPVSFRTVFLLLEKPPVPASSDDESARRAREFRSAFFDRAWDRADGLLLEEAWYRGHPLTYSADDHAFYPDPEDLLHPEPFAWSTRSPPARPPRLSESATSWDGMPVEPTFDVVTRAREASRTFAACPDPNLAASPGSLEEARALALAVEEGIACLERGFAALYPQLTLSELTYGDGAGHVVGAPARVGAGNRLASTLEMTFRAEWNHIDELRGAQASLTAQVAAWERALDEDRRRTDEARRQGRESRCAAARDDDAALQERLAALDSEIATLEAVASRYGVVNLSRLYSLGEKRLQLEATEPEVRRRIETVCLAGAD
jgi:hypothetical protein